MTTVTVYVDFGLREHEPRTLPASCGAHEGQHLTLAEYREHRERARVAGMPRPDKRSGLVLMGLTIIAAALVAAALTGARP